MDDNLNYMESIIQATHKNLNVFMEGKILKAVWDLDIAVNKERLIRALSDAQSYYKEGYDKGIEDSVKHSRWMPRGGDPDASRYFCEHCKFEVSTIKSMYYDYCPECGYKMDLNEGGSK